jgi:hypothetical protein
LGTRWHTYLDKFSIKHAYFETDQWGVKDKAGMLTGKKGLPGELATLMDVIEQGIPAVLCDITNTLRYGDVCLLGGSDPFLIEVKSSPKINERGKRQIAKLTKLHSFLKTDEAVDFRGSKGITKRLNLLVPERDNMKELNACITRAKQEGQCIVQPERGVTYVATYGQPDLDAIGKAIEGTAIADYYMLNMDKNDHEWAPYTPFILSIRDLDHLLDFIEGRLSLFVIIDIQVLCDLMADDEWAVRYRPDGDYAIQCMHRPTRGFKGISRQFVGRLGYEFISLSWIADHHRSTVQHISEMANSLGGEQDPKAQGHLLLDMFGPDDEWTKDIIV